MPLKSASCEAGLGTRIRKSFRSLIYFSWSINFQTDEYSRQLHLEVCKWNASSHLRVSGWNPHGDRNKKISFVKEDYKCFISINYDNLSQISWKNEIKVDDKNATTRTWTRFLLQTRLCCYHTTLIYTNICAFKKNYFCYKERGK